MADLAGPATTEQPVGAPGPPGETGDAARGATAAVTVPADASARSGGAGSGGRGGRAAIAVLVGLPLALFALPALAGHPVWPGDDLTQNEPLRNLVGAQLRGGHLPLFDPYIWSGAPLLGGWNAGAAYPFTWLFAVAPGALGWTLNLLLTWWVAGLGFYWFCRANRLRPLASLLGSVTAVYAGAMVAQIPHIGLVAGISWIPIQLVALLELSRAGSWSRRAPWAALLAGAFAMTILAGEPRGIDEAVVVSGLYALWRVLRLGRRAGPYLAGVGLACALGVAIGAVQVVPGVYALQASQRARHTFDLFNGGSLSLRWLTLLLVPNILGGSGTLGAPQWLANYNLTEVVGYVGVLPLVALGSMAARFSRRERPEWPVWYAVVALGLVLALGGSTPAWHVLIHLPLYGGQRLQSRNLLIVDIGAAMLFAHFVEAWLADGGRLSPPGAPRWRKAAARLGAGVPLGGVGVLVTLGVLAPHRLLVWLGAIPTMLVGSSGLRPWLLPFAAGAGAAAALLAVGSRIRPCARGGWMLGLALADVSVLTLTCVVAVAPNFDAVASSPAPSPAAAAARAPVPPPSAALFDTGAGRAAVFDPDLLNGTGLVALGVPDQNVVAGRYWAQGYSSIVNGAYAAATGTHQAMGVGQDVLAPWALADGTFDQLATTVVATLPAYLIVPARTPAGLPPNVVVPGGDPAAGLRSAAAGAPATWTFGETLAVTSLSIPVAPTPNPGAAPGNLWQVGLERGDGTVAWSDPQAPSPGGSLSVTFGSAVGAFGLVVRSAGAGGPLGLGAPTVAEQGGGRYVADGQLQGALLAPHWVYGGSDGPFALYRNTRAAAPLTLRALPGRTTAGATVRRIAGAVQEPSAARVSSPHGVEVVRAVAAIPGWKATWTPRGGRPFPLALRVVGLVQGADVPAGQGVLSWRYEAPGFAVGSAAAGVGVVGVVLLALTPVVLRRRGRGGGRRLARGDS